MSKLKVAGLVALFFIAVFVNLVVGSVFVSVGDFFDMLMGNPIDSSTYTTLIYFRIPKTLTAIIVGVGLSISGLVMQTIFRNPLAGPYVLGVSSGAGLGVALVTLGVSFFGFIPSNGLVSNALITIFAMVGAASVLLLLLIVSIRIGDIMTILILGMLFGSSISAIIGILQFFSPESMLKAYVIWTMGSLAMVDYAKLLWLSVIVVLGLAMIILRVKDLDLMLLGEKYAISSGMNLIRFRIWIFVATSLLAGSITAFCGPIAFIGVAVPHVARMLVKSTHHLTLIFYSVLIGATTVLMADTISQMPGYTGVLPINSVTALMGIPVVVWIVVKNHRLGSAF